MCVVGGDRGYGCCGVFVKARVLKEVTVLEKGKDTELFCRALHYIRMRTRPCVVVIYAVV